MLEFRGRERVYALGADQLQKKTRISKYVDEWA